MPVPIPGAKPRAILTMLGLHNGSVVSADTLVELLWGEDPPRTAAKALQTHISSLRRTLGDGFVLTVGSGWTLAEAEVDAARHKSAARLGRDAAAAGDTSQAMIHFEEALALWRGIPELPDGRRGTSEKTRWLEGHAALVEDRADALLATGRAAELIGELEAAVADAPLRERRWCQLMLALYRAGRQGEALGAYQRARALLAEELGVDPGPELRRLEASIVAQDAALEVAVAQGVSSVTRAVTFLLTDIEGSTAAWEADADAMAVALARHDELVEQVVTSRGGRLIKTRGEGDATFSVFERPSAAAAAAIELQEAVCGEPWALRGPMRIRVALHTGEVELRDGDYFGRAVNRAARLRSLAVGGQIVCSGATAELVIDTLADDVVLIDRGMRQLRNLARPEHVFELRLETAEERPATDSTDAPLERPALPAVLAGPGPFVGRGQELGRLFSAWQTALAGATNAVLIAGEPGVGKTRLAGEWSWQAYEQGALVLYGRCDEDLGAPYQPFAEALRALVPCLGTSRLRGLRGVEALLPLVPGLTDVLPDLAAPTRADPDTERYALFDAVVAVLGVAAAGAPVVLILDDLHWAAKPTLLLLRHLLRFGEQARVQIVGTYRSTDLDRSHPLAAMLADLHRDGTANRLALGGLDEGDVTAYVAEAGYDDEELARALASVTGGNPFFLIEALRHVDESGGHWDPSTLPQGVREAVSRRLSRLPAETNKALGAAAVVGSRFALELVERVVGEDLVDAFDEACKAGIVIEEPGGRYRFNHALVRQSLLAELPSVRRMRLHQRIAATLENEHGPDDELLAELAYHYFECAWAGNAAKAVEYCRRAADQAMTRLAYEGAADLYDRALHALEEIDDELPDRDEHAAELLLARCEALLAAGDVASAAAAVVQLQAATADSARLAAWATCFDAQLSMLIHPERLDEAEAAVGAAADKLAELGDAAGEAKAHTVRAACLARLGRIGDCEIALDDALTAARRAGEYRRVNAVLAGAALAALWGPNPVPRAGGRCLDVVRLLRITTDSPAVEATSTRCQAVLEAFRGRAAPARRMIDSARRTVTELGLRHGLLEVEQFAGIVELVVDDPASAEPHLRKAYNGFRRMGLDADTAETAALLGRACLALGRDAEADELCSESVRLAGHALKPSIAWRALRAHLLSRGLDHEGARRVAEAAVALAERTDLLVDHGDACLALATVLGRAGDAAGARAAAERAIGLYERKGAAALKERAGQALGAEPSAPPLAAETEPPHVELDNACLRVLASGDAAIRRRAWDEFQRHLATDLVFESRCKIVGVGSADLRSGQWQREVRRILEVGETVVHRRVAVAVRGERLALTRVEVGTPDVSLGAPRTEALQLHGVGEDGRITLELWFDIEDLDAAIAELDAAHARLQDEPPIARRPENAAALVFEHVWSRFAARDWDAMAGSVADDYVGIDHRRVVSAETQHSRDDVIRDLQAAADVGFTISMVSAVAIRGERLVLARVRASGSDPEAIQNDALNVVEIDTADRIAKVITFDLEDIDAALAELDARYLAGEAAAHAHTWSVIKEAYAALNRHELSATHDRISLDHRRATTVPPGDMAASVRATWDVAPNISRSIEAVHRLNNLGAVITHTASGTSQEGFDAEWRLVALFTVTGELISRAELFDETDLNAALARFDQLSRPASRLENTASQVAERFLAQFARHDWDGMTEILADNFSSDDRRGVVGAGVRHGRDAQIADMRAIADLWVANFTSTVMATRGERLVLMRAGLSFRDQGPEAFLTEVLGIVEINADQQMVALVSFGLDDFDAAITELDARYLAGEAEAHARTWSAITRSYDALNRHELPPTTRDCVNIDHRPVVAIEEGVLGASLRAVWDLVPQATICIEAVHRLSDLGAVITHVVFATSREGFDAEWLDVVLLTFEGDKINRCEVFDEADVDSAIARFDQLSRPALRLENAASQAYERVQACFAARDWDAMANAIAHNMVDDDRRYMVNAGIRRGRDIQIANSHAVVEIGGETITSTVIATRGGRLALCRSAILGQGEQSGAFRIEFLSVVESDAEERLAGHVAFDLDEFDTAIAELDARYLAGEAGAHAHTWSVITESYAALNRREHPATTSDWVNIDHRRGISFAPGDVSALLANWNTTSDLSNSIEAVHRLNDRGAVVTSVTTESSREGFEAEWRGINVLTIEGDLIDRLEVFDEADLEAALAHLEELHRTARRLENAATRTAEQFLAHYAVGNWDAMAELLLDDMASDDRRRVVNAGIRRGRDVEIANWRGNADILATDVRWTVVATRGERLALLRFVFVGQRQAPAAFQVSGLSIIEISMDAQIVALVSFDLDDLEAAIAELDARYLAGEASPHATTWSAVTDSFAALNRREHPSTTHNWVNVDHRQGTSFAPGEMTAYIRAAWNLEQEVKIYVEAVHGLSDGAAFLTSVTKGVSREGFGAEWRSVHVLAFEGRMTSRCELFEEADIVTALARFEQLSRPVPRLENAASRMYERLQAHYAAHDWAAISEMLSEDHYSDDRRALVGNGIQHGRDTVIENLRTVVDVGVTQATSHTVATRGGRLALTLARYSRSDEEPPAFHVDYLQLIELGADERITALVAFDLDRLDDAYEELDARYLAGEAEPYARVWQIGMETLGELNRHQPGPRIAELMFTDYRHIGFRSGDFGRAVEELWELVPEARYRMTEVYALDAHASVFKVVIEGTDVHGNELQWPRVSLLSVGREWTRLEIYEEEDVDAALARFEDLRPEARRLENAASRMVEQFLSDFAVRDWDAMAELLADDVSSDDRRRTVNAGIRRGRDVEMDNWRATAEVWTTDVGSTVLATRGERLVLFRFTFASQEALPESFQAVALAVVEVNTNHRATAIVVFELDDFESAFAELDARYLAGEAAAYANAWSVITNAIAAHNRREVAATTPDAVSFDHRRVASFAPGQGVDYLRAGWDLDQTLNLYIETAHRLNNLGAVFTWAGYGASHEGFQAEWRGVNLMTVDGEMVDRSEVFDEADLDAALAQFDQLSRRAPRPENAASHAYDRFRTYFAARDWAAMAELLTPDTSVDDHRRVVNAEIRRGRDVEIANMQAFADIGAKTSTATVLATRGERLVLCRSCISSEDHQQSGGFRIEMLIVVETRADERILARVAYDPDDVDAALAELDARYLAGEAAVHARTWSVIAGSYAALNRREPPLTKPDCVYGDHRRETAFGPGDLTAYFGAGWTSDQDINVYVEQVHRLESRGAVITYAAHETREGFDAEWRGVAVLTVDGDLIDRCEVFDDADARAALARFEELSRSARLDNAASRVCERYLAHYAARDWDAVAEILAQDFCSDDRRRVVSAGFRHGRDAQVANMQAFAALAIARVTAISIATRGERLVLQRVSFSDPDQTADPFLAERLGVGEINAAGRIAAFVSFDPDALDTAIAELDARYLAGEAAAYARTWSVFARAATNRHEALPTTPDCVTIDHRLRATLDAEGLTAYVHASWELTPDLRVYVESVHRLSALGAVVTHASRGTSHDDFDAEWRQITLLTVEGDLGNHCEIFDEADLDTALARFEELSADASGQGNTATKVCERFSAHLAAGDWGAIAQSFDDNFSLDDRRRLVGAGVRHGRDDEITDLRTLADLGLTSMASTVLATRGERVFLVRARMSFSDREKGPEAYLTELLGLVEIDADERIVGLVGFDLDDIDAAFAELDARYLADEATPYAGVWRLGMDTIAELNRHEPGPMLGRLVYADHRRIPFASGEDFRRGAEELWALVPDARYRVRAVHAIDTHGDVVTFVIEGTDADGNELQWCRILLFACDEPRVEVYDEDDLDAALTRFEELRP